MKFKRIKLYRKIWSARFDNTSFTVKTNHQFLYLKRGGGPVTTKRGERSYVIQSVYLRPCRSISLTVSYALLGLCSICTFMYLPNIFQTFAQTHGLWSQHVRRYQRICANINFKKYLLLNIFILWRPSWKESPMSGGKCCLTPRLIESQKHNAINWHGLACVRSAQYREDPSFQSGSFFSKIHTSTYILTCWFTCIWVMY